MPALVESELGGLVETGEKIFINVCGAVHVVKMFFFLPFSLLGAHCSHIDR